MAVPLIIKHISSVEYCTELPDNDEPHKTSPIFSAMGDTWNISFLTDTENYFAHLKQNPRKDIFDKPFQLDYKVTLNEDDSCLGKGSVIVKSCDTIFWNHEVSSVRNSMSPGYRIGNVIKFSLRFLLPNDTALQIERDSHDKCVQTSSYLHTDLSSESLSKDFSQLLDKGINQDAELRCGKFSSRVHMTVLCARSKVFNAMLQSDMQEGRTKVITMQDFDASFFRDNVRYLYTDALSDPTFEKVVALYEAGDKYTVRSLMLRCSEYLQDSLTLDNAFVCFSLAMAHSDQKLKDRVIAYMAEENIYLQEGLWSPFCESYPKIALDVYKLMHKKESQK